MDLSLDHRLCKAVWEGNVEDVNELIVLGADINCYNENGNTPLHLGIEQCDFRMVTVLLDQGADVNLRTRDGFWTPLIHSVEAVSVVAINLGRAPDNRIVRLLVDRGASFTERTSDNRTALDYALRERNLEAIRLLSGAK